MNIFNVFTPEQLEALPEDHREAFVAFVMRAEEVLEERTRSSSQQNEDEAWRYINDERHGFMNIVIAAAKRYGVTEFGSTAVPSPKNFGESEYAEFRSDLDHYLTQIYIDNSVRAKRDAVPLEPKAKERLRSYILELRNCIEKADMTEAKRQALHKRLTAFEAELERSRLSLLAVTRVTRELMALGSGAWQATEITYKLISNVMHEVAMAKAADDETRQLPHTSAPAMISPPRPPTTSRERRVSAPAFEPGGMDDDIPF
ncbi:hypothetical protein [Devosia psychrophila]|uniref:Uncharacterized protein n=1 Tax=Devosia psychrophila TaxID=728005 RepID=A0A1I1GEM5_9HYPH|nr:hypothetical protein [Devosia psychrophila]SFC10247.1 hypothetical protein SAMN04488059_102138 [Devosia psychrophila]